MDEIRACTGKQYPVIHLIGGGAQSGLLCQMTANACGLPVVAGPVEATVYGNTMAQFMALGELKDVYKRQPPGRWACCLHSCIRMSSR